MYYVWQKWSSMSSRPSFECATCSCAPPPQELMWSKADSEWEIPRNEQISKSQRKIVQYEQYEFLVWFYSKFPYAQHQCCHNLNTPWDGNVLQEYAHFPCLSLDRKESKQWWRLSGERQGQLLCRCLAVRNLEGVRRTDGHFFAIERIR